MKQAINIFYDVFSLANAIIDSTIDRKVFAGMSSEQRDLLEYLEHHGDCSPGELATFQNVSKSAISNRLKKLVEKEFVVYKRPLIGDRRSAKISITAQGLETTNAITEAMCAILQQALTNVTHEQIDSLIATLTPVRDTLQQIKERPQS